MLSKKFAPVLLLSLILVLAASFMAFADEADEAEDNTPEVEEEVREEAEEETAGSSVIVTDEIMKQWEQTETDEYNGPDIINALIGQAAADPDAPGIASAVIGRSDIVEIDLPSGDEGDEDASEEADADAIMEYYAAVLAMINEASASANETGPAFADNSSSTAATAENAPITDADGRELVPLGRFAVTKYCPCSICCGSGGGMTASGKRARSNHTIAADTRLYPFGTQLMVNGIIYTVEDMGSGVRGNTVDIFVDSHAEAVAYGTQYADVYLVR